MNAYIVIKRRDLLLVFAALVFLAATIVFGLVNHHAKAFDPNRPIELTWKILSLLNTQTGERPPIVDRLQGATVKIAGYMVPLEDELDQVNEFLLVPYEGACIHTPPPPANQMIHVKMTKAQALFTWQAIWVEGRFSLSETKSPYGMVNYELLGNEVHAFSDRDRERSRLGIDL